MEMHPHYTEVPLRSFEAMVFEGNLSEVLLALIVDPHEAEDVARTIQEIYATRIELSLNGKIVDAPIALSDFTDISSKDAFERLKITLSQWVMKTERSDAALMGLAEWDQRLGAWCACAVARDVLRILPDSEQRPLRAIETAEAWVLGKATTQQITASASDAADAYSETWSVYAAEFARTAFDEANAAYARSCVCSAAENAALATDSAIRAVDSARSAATARVAARATARTGVLNEDDRNAELFGLRDVVANACLTFPG